jgi:sugar lactone lactonase YvrE
MRIEVLVDVKTTLGEGPLWDVEEQRLYWIDSHGRAVHRCDARGQDLRSWGVPEHIGSACLREKGGAVVSLRDGFHFLDLGTGEVEPIVDPEPHLRRTRLNDGKVDRQGRFVAGGMDYEEREPLAGLYRLDPDLTVTQLEASSSATARAGASTAGPSTSPTPGRGASGPTTTTRRPATS